MEVMFVTVLTLTLGAVATAQFFDMADDLRAAAAVRYVATKLQQTRMEAVSRSAAVAWQFVATASGYSYAVYLDGNGNGVRTTEIQHGVDIPIGSVEGLSERFAGVDFGIVPGLPPIDSGGPSPGTDPIKFGTSNILTFTPLGTASSGTLYVRGRRNVQYAIRVQGETARSRVLKFDVRAQQWKSE